MSPERTKQAIENEFVSLARSVFGDQLVALILYGSYVKDSYVQGVSDINVLIIVAENRPGPLSDLGSRGSRLMSRHRITPLVLSRKEFVTSADVFPMEYLDIVDAHQVLVGKDVTGELSIDRSNLRHQIEHQLRGHLLSLRQLAIAAGRRRLFRKSLLRRELQQWYGRLSAILRSLLRLKEVSPIPTSPEALMAAVNDAFGFESGPIVQLLTCRNGGAGCPDSLDLVDEVIERLASLVSVVDGMPGGGREVR